MKKGCSANSGFCIFPPKWLLQGAGAPACPFGLFPKREAGADKAAWEERGRIQHTEGHGGVGL